MDLFGSEDESSQASVHATPPAKRPKNDHLENEETPTLITMQRLLHSPSQQIPGMRAMHMPMNPMTRPRLLRSPPQQIPGMRAVHIPMNPMTRPRFPTQQIQGMKAMQQGSAAIQNESSSEDGSSSEDESSQASVHATPPAKRPKNDHLENEETPTPITMQRLLRSPSQQIPGMRAMHMPMNPMTRPRPLRSPSQQIPGMRAVHIPMNPITRPRFPTQQIQGMKAMQQGSIAIQNESSSEDGSSSEDESSQASVHATPPAKRPKNDHLENEETPTPITMQRLLRSPTQQIPGMRAMHMPMNPMTRPRPLRSPSQQIPGMRAVHIPMNPMTRPRFPTQQIQGMRAMQKGSAAIQALSHTHSSSTAQAQTSSQQLTKVSHTPVLQPQEYRDQEKLSPLEFLELLGEGSFGSVHKAQIRENGILCAVKRPTRQSRDFLDKFRKECELMKDIKHPNIIACFGVSTHYESGNLMLRMELMDKNLTQLLKECQKDLPEYVQIDISFQVASALAYLHSRDIIHRDLSSNNVLIKGNTVKVADFGMAKLLEEGVSLTGFPGATCYMPPEAQSDSPKYSEKLDIFSMGVLMVQIITRAYPAPTTRDQQLTAQIYKKVPEVERRQNHINMVCNTHPLRALFMKCLHDDSDKRSTAKQLVDFLWLCQNSEQYFTSIRQGLGNEAKLHTEIEELKKQLDQKDKQMTEKEQSIVNMKTNSERRAVLLKEFLEKKEQALQQKDTRIKRTEEQLQKLREKNATQEQALQQKDKRIKRTEEQLQKLREKDATQEQALREKDTHIKRTEAQLQQLREKDATQEQALREKDTRIIRTEAQLQQLREKNATQEQALREKDTRIKRTEAQLQQLREKNATQEQALREKDTRIKRTEAQLQQLREKNATQEQALREKDTRIIRTEAQCKTWLQATLENAPQFMKTWDKETDDEDHI